uniref:Uncharacterized protein n=1 Tax=Cucumis melo TaxID=3656 RepID=A0A9I9DXC2_CUCME
MQGTSKVILGATLIMVVSLAIVLGLILVLLAELYCSLLLRRRRLRVAPPTTTSSNLSGDPVATATNISQSLPSAPRGDNNRSAISLSSLYAHGVLTSPDVSILKACAQSKLSPAIACNDSSSNGSDHFMYISNPIYDNDAIRPSRGDNTPFETPSSSPSRLERCSSSEEDEIVASPSSTIHSLPNTPPLTPMKKLPAEACSVTLRDARSLGNSGSDSNTHNGLSSSSSGSPCTSPSW